MGVLLTGRSALGRAGGRFPIRTHIARRRRELRQLPRTNRRDRLGAQGGFERGNVGLLTRRVSPGQVVNAVPPLRRTVRLPRPPKIPKPPRIAETLHKALEWRRQLDAVEVPNQAAIARREGITRARVTQILMLLRLTPEIQERILRMAKTVNPPRISERSLRSVALLDACRQDATLDAFLG